MELGIQGQSNVNDVGTIEESPQINKILKYIDQNFQCYARSQNTNSISFPDFIKHMLNLAETMFLDEFKVMNEDYKKIYKHIYDTCKSYDRDPHTHVYLHIEESLGSLLCTHHDLLQKISIYKHILADHGKNSEI